MDNIAIKPTNITEVAHYLLRLDCLAVEQAYHSDWPQRKQRLQETLEAYANPGRIVGENLIDHLDRSLRHLFDSARLLIRQLTTEKKQQLQKHLQIVEQLG